MSVLRGYAEGVELTNHGRLLHFWQETEGAQHFAVRTDTKPEELHYNCRVVMVLDKNQRVVSCKPDHS